MNIDKMVDKINKKIAKQKVRDAKRTIREDKKADRLFYGYIIETIVSEFLVSVSKGKTEGVIRINVKDYFGLDWYYMYGFLYHSVRGIDYYEEMYATLSCWVLENKFAVEGYIFQSSADCVKWEKNSGKFRGR